MIQAARAIEAHTVGSAVLVGEPLPTYEHEEPCDRCGARLSVYSDKDTCWPCLNTERLEAAARAQAEEAQRRAEEQRLREAKGEDRERYKRVSRQDIKEYLTEHPGARANQAALVFETRVATMSQLLRSMEKKGELRREEGSSGTSLGGHRYYIKDGDS